MTVTVEHLATAHSGLGLTPHYRCHCGRLFRSTSEAHGCRHRYQPVTSTGRQDCPGEYDRQLVPGELSMPDRHEPTQLTLEVNDA